MKREILLGLMAGVISFTSCDVDLLDIPQQGVTNEEAFYKTDQDCEEAIAAVYRSWLSPEVIEELRNMPTAFS